MVLDPLDNLDLSELPDYDADAEYCVLLKALRRQQGFGILFVRCSPDQGRKLIDDLIRDLPGKRCGELTLTEPLPDGDFFSTASAFLADHPAEVVFVRGMEHSLLDYEETKRQSGWTKAESQNYSWRNVPPIVWNLNQQRDRARLPHWQTADQSQFTPTPRRLRTARNKAPATTTEDQCRFRRIGL